MKRKIITICAIALAGFSLTLSLLGCKKDKPKEVSSMEENADEDVSEDESEDSE